MCRSCAFTGSIALVYAKEGQSSLVVQLCMLPSNLNGPAIILVAEMILTHHYGIAAIWAIGQLFRHLHMPRCQLASTTPLPGIKEAN